MRQIPPQIPPLQLQCCGSGGIFVHFVVLLPLLATNGSVEKLLFGPNVRLCRDVGGGSCRRSRGSSVSISETSSMGGTLHAGNGGGGGPVDGGRGCEGCVWWCRSWCCYMSSTYRASIRRNPPGSKHRYYRYGLRVSTTGGGDGYHSITIAATVATSCNGCGCYCRIEVPLPTTTTTSD